MDTRPGWSRRFSYEAGSSSTLEVSLLAAVSRSASFPHCAMLDITRKQWKDRPFVLRRWDLDLTVFPNKYIEELRAYPANKISGIHAHIGV
jgi:hypothetical protein